MLSRLDYCIAGFTAWTLAPPKSLACGSKSGPINLSTSSRDHVRPARVNGDVVVDWRHAEYYLCLHHVHVHVLGIDIQQLATELKLLRCTSTFRRKLETFYFSHYTVCTRVKCVMRHQSSSVSAIVRCILKYNR